MNLDFQPVTQERWSDFEKLFESRGGPHNCWCMVWRTNENAKTMPGKAGKKASMKRRIIENVPVGLLAYAEGEPVAWCSIAPRDTYRSLGGDESKKGVWSLVCFFVKRPYRGQGIAAQLIQAAIRYAAANGARVVEAYPVDPDSPSYLFMGFKPTFEKAGFQFIKMAGTRRNVMILELS